MRWQTKIPKGKEKNVQVMQNVCMYILLNMELTIDYIAAIYLASHWQQNKNGQL